MTEPSSNGRKLARLILVSGLPATGKTSLAGTLGDALGIPMINKDGIKEQLFDTIGWSDREWSKKLGAASSEMIWFLAERHVRVGGALVLESNFDRKFTDPAIAELRASWPLRVIEVHCLADRDVLIDRYRQRAEAGDRHPGHMEWAEQDMENDLLPRIRNAEDLRLEQADELIEVDTTDFERLDVSGVIEKVRLAI